MKTKKAFSDEVGMSLSQINAGVKERNAYRRLLDDCLYALNALHDQRIQDGDGGTTYKLASKIEQAFKEFD